MRAARFRGDVGTAIIETALVTVALFTVLLGIVEAGYMYRDYQITSDSASDGSRVGALLGPNPGEDGASADYHIIRALRDATGSMAPEWVERIVIFKGVAPTGAGAGSPAAQVPAPCKAGTPLPDRCNVYNDPYEAFVAVETGDVEYFACPGTGPACSWPAADRRDGPTVSAIEYVGVWIRVQRPYLTKFFGSTLTLEDASVTRIEVGALTG